MARKVPVVWIEEKGRWFSGLLLAPSKSPSVLLESGEKRQVRQESIRFQSEVMVAPDPEQLQAYAVQVQAEIQNIEAQLSELWQLLQPSTGSPEKTTHTAEELASFLGDPAAQPLFFDAIRVQLFRGSVYFRRRGEGFGLVEAHAVQQRERQQRALAREQKKLQGRVAALNDALAPAAWGDRAVEMKAGGAFSEACQLLELIALDRQEDSRLKEARKLLEAILGSPPGNASHAAFELLVRLGVYKADELLELRSEEIRDEFSGAVTDAAEKIRQDLRSMEAPPPCSLYPVTIDDGSSMDLDDAVALEESEAGDIVHVMITDVVGALPPDSEITREACQRASTLYLPDRVIPIFPPSLSEGALSLLPQSPRQVLDFQVRLGKDGAPLDLEIVPTRIEVAERMTYEKVDELLSQPKTDFPRGTPGYNLHRLREIAFALRHNRSKRGAFLWSMDEYKIQASPDEVSIHRINAVSPARILVQELMVLLGWMTASYCLARDIPLIFRLQRSEEAPPMTARPSIAEIFARIITMSPATLSPVPGPHEGLGIPSYVQTTSPLRRFQDYLSQLQIRSFLKSGTPAMGSDELMEKFQVLEAQNRVHKRVMRVAARYWILRYYADRVEFNTEAVVLQTWARKVRLIFMDTGFQMDYRNDREIPAGTTVGVTILGAEARTGRLHIRIR